MHQRPPIRIASVSFERFKAFRKFTLSLNDLNILVGPNNSGKSTIIGAFRALASGLRIARSSEPRRVTLKTGVVVPGYRIPEASLPISLENVHTDYDEEESSVVFTLTTKDKLRLLFPEEGECYLVPEPDAARITSRAHFKKHYPLSVLCVPVLGPVEHREERREKSTVAAGLETHRASRHFRSYWHHFPEGFEEFAAQISRTWPGMEIRAPEISDALKGELEMYCYEDRIARELFWVGFGFQVWCQMLTHLSRARNCTLVVVDEPEVYLHPDLQRQLLAVVRELGPDIVMATHSTEIMSEADPSDIVLVDKKTARAQRLKDTESVQRALDALGSLQNITLTSLARNRRVLFVEDVEDFRLIRRVARKLGLGELGGGIGITPVSSGGFGSWARISAFAETIGPVLGSKLSIAAIYDRDYFCDEEIEKVLGSLKGHLSLAYVLGRKEIENYLLLPETLQKALNTEIVERAHRTGKEPDIPLDVKAELDGITRDMRDETQAQFVGRRVSFFKSGPKDPSQITMEAMGRFATQWATLESRLQVVSGKQVLSRLRDKVQVKHGVSLTDARIVDAMIKSDVPAELISLIDDLEDFRAM